MLHRKNNYGKLGVIDTLQARIISQTLNVTAWGPDGGFVQVLYSKCITYRNFRQGLFILTLEPKQHNDSLTEIEVVRTGEAHTL